MKKAYSQLFTILFYGSLFLLQQTQVEKVVKFLPLFFTPPLRLSFPLPLPKIPV